MKVGVYEGVSFQTVDEFDPATFVLPAICQPGVGMDRRQWAAGMPLSSLSMLQRREE